MLKTFTIKATKSGERIDSFLSNEIEELSRSQIVNLIGNEALTKDGKVLKKNHKTQEGEVYVLLCPELEESELLAQDIPLHIVYEDDDLVVIDKPRGMVVHPAAGHSDGTLVNALMFHCGESLSGIGGEKRPGIVHRIDKDTSGLLVVAKNDYAHRFLSAQLSDHSLYRIYEAVVYGNFRDYEGEINAPIGRHPIDRKRMAVTTKNSKEAITHYKVLAQYRGYSHVECRLHTGRTHQIRVHMNHIGHPLVGDLVYGPCREHKGIAGQCLFAKKLRLVHPRSQEEMEFEIETPDYFNDVLGRLGNIID